MRSWVKTTRGLLLSVVVGCAPLGCNHGNRNALATGGGSPFDRAHDPPITADTHFAAGQLSESQNHLEEALAQYKEALRLQPKHLPAMYRLGVVYAALKQYGDAIEQWNRYIDATGGSAEAYSNLGFCQELAGNPPAAEVAYKSGIAKDPHNEPCRVNYGLMLARHGRTSEALVHLLTVLPAGQAHYDLGSVLEQQGHKAEARAEYEKAIALDPKLSDAKTKLADLGKD